MEVLGVQLEAVYFKKGNRKGIQRRSTNMRGL